MDGEPRYRLEVVAGVFGELGFKREKTGDPTRLAWSHVVEDGIHIGTYKVPDASMTIRESHVLAIARQLGIVEPGDMDKLVQRLRRAGGEFLG